MLTIKIKNKKIKLLNWIIFLFFIVLILYVIFSLIFLLPIFKKGYEDKIKKENYSITSRTLFSNELFNCNVTQEFELYSKNKEILNYLKELMQKDGFKIKNGNKMIARTKSLGSCKSKKKEYEKFHKKGYVIYKLNGNSKVKVNYGDNYEDEYVTFKVNNKEVKDVVISSNLNIKKPGNYIIAYKLKLSSFNYYLFRVVSVIDNLKPTINLLGEDKVILDFNQAYKEPGFTATDNYDGDITNKVIVKNNVNIKKPGTYKVSYKVSDSNGNFEKKERIVIVKEKTDSVVKETPKIEVIDGITYVNGILLVNKTYHLPSNYDPKVNKEALEALKEMQADCQAIGLNIPLVSGYRSFETQKKLYGNYVKRDGEKIANTYSAKPGESEHQTGLSFDVGKVDSSFANTKEAKWIDENAYLYGFIVRYPKNKTNITGYIYEPWHIRYLGKKTAKMVYESKLTLEEYLGVD